jgi:Methyltransferase domain
LRENPERCAILVPVHQAIDPEVDDSLQELARRGYPVLVLRGSSAIDMARNDLANQAMDLGYEETFWIDADVVFKPDDVDKVREHGIPFVAGLYPKKGRREFACKFWPTIQDIIFGVGGGLRNMQYVGMGFTYIRAEVYHKIASDLKLPRVKGGYTVGKKIVPYFLPMLAPNEDEEGEVYLAEDASLCERARQVGFTVMADTTIRLDHMGRRKWCWEDFAPQTVYDSLKFSMAVDEPAPTPAPSATAWKFPAEVRGWLTEEEGIGLADLARGKDVLEVGSYCGRSTICMAQTARSLCCVDPFDYRDTPVFDSRGIPTGEGSTFEEFRRNLERYQVRAAVFQSLFANTDFQERFGLIFIDGAHDEVSVAADAAKATRLLTPDGLLAFHDYRVTPGYHNGGWHPGVTNTVHRLIAEGAERVRTIGSIAVIRPAKSSAQPQEPKEIMSDKLYAKLGQKQEALEDLNNAYNSLLLMTASVVSGEIAASQVLINLTARSWEVVPAGQRPQMPATVNGEPRCVVAPPNESVQKAHLSEALLRRADAVLAEGNGSFEGEAD